MQQSTLKWIIRNKLPNFSGGLIVIFMSAIWMCRSEGDTECPLGYFSCNFSDLCIEQRQICDGLMDCADESDEWSCDSKHHYEYWNRFYKKRPDEDSDKLMKSENCDVENPPENCVCQNRRIYCGNRGLVEIPKSLPLGITYLDLSSNDIQYVKCDDLHNGNQLENLLLSNCLIKQVEKGCFDELVMLKALYLTGNRLESIDDGVFRNNNRLLALDLSFNHIRDVTEDNFLGLEQLEDLDLRGNRLELLKTQVFRHLRQLKILYLNDNQLKAISAGTFNCLTKLQLLYLTNNQIHQLEESSFRGLEGLNGLFLSWNHLPELRAATFDDLTGLLNLDLSNNRLNHFHFDCFKMLQRLEFLNLRGNPFRRLHPHLLQPLTRLTHIDFQNFYLCGYALHVRVCMPKSDGISSLENLLDSLVLRISVWIVAIVACFGNLFVLVGRMLLKEPNLVHSFYIKSLAASDFLMGIYLLIVAAYDVNFRGRYIEFDEKWRHSWQCQLAGFLSTMSSEASVFTLTVITYDRYFSISRPLALQRRTKRFATTCTISLWSTAFVLSLLPLLPIPYYGLEFYGNNGVCLALHIHDPFSDGWEYSAIIFILINFCAFAFIFYAYINMFFIIKDSTVSLRSTQEKQDRTIAQRFAFIVGTDLICWMPIIIIKIMALCGVAIQDNLYAWLAIFVMPVNSALNPILYTMTTKLFRQQLLLWRSSYRSSSGGGHNARNPPDSLGLSLSYVFFHRASWSKRTINQSSSKGFYHTQNGTVVTEHQQSISNSSQV